MDSYQQVLKPFEVKSGTVAPVYGQDGFGTQYLSPVKVDILDKKGIITKTNN